MQGIYTYIPETNHVPKEYNGAAILSLLFMVPISLASALVLIYFYISTFRSMCAVPNMAVFCSSLTSGFPGIIIIIIIIIIPKFGCRHSVVRIANHHEPDCPGFELHTNPHYL